MIRDRTHELSFASINDAAVETLLEVHTMVLKEHVSREALQGVTKAYNQKRSLQLPRRLIAKGLRAVVNEQNPLVTTLTAKDITSKIDNLGRVLRPARLAIDQLLAVHEALFENPRLANTYLGDQRPTVAVFFASKGQQAFSPHQDPPGWSGLGVSLQSANLEWSIHKKDFELPASKAPIDFTFTTEPGDLVVQTQRVQPAPNGYVYGIPGSQVPLADGSNIHSAYNPSGGMRVGLGLFHEQS